MNWSDLFRFEHLATEDEHIMLYHQVVNHVQFKRNLQVVVVVDTQRHRYAVLFSTDVDLDPGHSTAITKRVFRSSFSFATPNNLPV